MLREFDIKFNKRPAGETFSKMLKSPIVPDNIPKKYRFKYKVTLIFKKHTQEIIFVSDEKLSNKKIFDEVVKDSAFYKIYPLTNIIVFEEPINGTRAKHT